MRVILKRQPYLPNEVFNDERPSQAMRRALTLAGLHNCDQTLTDDEIIVHASDWYKPKEPTGAIMPDGTSKA